MRPDPELVAETRAWLVRAAEDLREVEHDLIAAPPLLHGAVFHAQQAAEKAMKGFLTWHSRPFRKTHNLTEIGGLCVEVDPTLEARLRQAAVLTEYAWKYRYPGEPESPTREEAEGALGLARAVYEAVLARLPDEVRP
ncbi:MAG TPA: HEPN domain-containing protein [Chloroflexota bacterium]|nr:HEPN domain-containing protein [Chloroflexota bacterium]